MHLHLQLSVSNQSTVLEWFGIFRKVAFDAMRFETFPTQLHHYMCAKLKALFSINQHTVIQHTDFTVAMKLDRN